MTAQDFYPPIPVHVRKNVIQTATEKYAALQKLEPGFVIEALVSKLGGRITYGQVMGASRESESIKVFGDSDFIIYLAVDTSPLRDRFTIAHELGHFLIHYPQVVEAHGVGARMAATRFVDENDKELVRAEWEANWFAASLLMPEPVFRKTWASEGGDVSKLASFFKVTKQAADVRAQSLGLAK